MIELPQDADLKPLTWHGARWADGRRTANMACSHGHVAGLYDHDIAGDGTVTPSIVCPVDGCEFHDFVRLSGWSG